jgi:hypothetical protein
MLDRIKQRACGFVRCGKGCVAENGCNAYLSRTRKQSNRQTIIRIGPCSGTARGIGVDPDAMRHRRGRTALDQV